MASNDSVDEISLAYEQTLVYARDLRRLYEAEQRAREELEQLYATLREQERRLAMLVARLFTAHEDERRRVAYDIHDGLAQTLVGAYQHLQASEKLLAADAKTAERHRQRGLMLLEAALRESRRLIGQLRPTPLDDLGLGVALKQLVEDARADGSLEVALVDELAGWRCRSEIETAAFRIVQEALTNTRKHATADRAAVRVWLTADRLMVEVRDWGHGFDRSRATTGVGLESMVERAALLGGACRVESQPGQGTSVLASLPLAAAGA